MANVLSVARLEARVLRALTGCGRGISYGLGQGGYHPEDALPTRNGLSDCSGYVAWGLHLDRYQGDKGKRHSPFVPWIETSAIVRDAVGRNALFCEIERPVAGCVVVYGDRIVLGRKRQGHTGIVVKVRGLDFDVAHCSVGNDRKGDAIQVTNGGLFIRQGAIYAVLNEDFA